MERLVSQIVGSHTVLAGKINVADVALICARCAENVTFKGVDKMTMAKQMVGNVLDELQTIGAVDAKVAATLKTDIDSGLDLFESLICALVKVAHNPELVQMEQKIEAACVKMRSRRRKGQ